MKVLLITNKPHQTEAVVRSLQRTVPWPGAEVTILPTLLNGFFRFDFPRDLTSRDLPFVGDVRLRPGSRFVASGKKWFAWRGVCGDAEGRRTKASPTLHPWRCGFYWDAELGALLSNPTSIVATLRQLVLESDLVVRLNDDGHRDAVAFADVVSFGGALSDADRAALPPIAHASLHDLTDATVDAATTGLSRAASGTRAGGAATAWQPDDADELYGRGKDFFDYNWAVNAIGLLAPVLADAGLESSFPGDGDGALPVSAAALASKHVVLVLLHLARTVDRAAFAEHRLLSMMSEWVGTGRHPGRHEVGSPATQWMIVHNMRRLGLLEKADPIPSRPPAWLREGRGDLLLGALLALVEDAMHQDPGAAGVSVRERLAASGVFRTPKSDPGGLETSAPSEDQAFQALRQVAYRAVKLDLLAAPMDRDACFALGLLCLPAPRLRLSERGAALAALLPKSAYDPDLPFRLDAWCRAWPASRPQMSAYLCRYFGNLKRANGMRSLAGCGRDAAVCARALLSGAPDVASAARLAQVSPEVLLAAADDGGVTVGQATAIVLAARRAGWSPSPLRV